LIKKFNISNGFIDTSKIDNIRIIYSDDIPFYDDYIYITYYGYFYNPINEQLENVNTRWKHYVNNISLYFNHPTQSITFYFNQDNLTGGCIQLYFDGILVKNVNVDKFDKDNKFKTIYLHDTKNFFNLKSGIENNYLNNFMNNNSVNLSRINSVELVYHNVDIIYIQQNFFVSYYLPSMAKIFSD